MNSDKIKKRLQQSWSSASGSGKLSKSIAFGAGLVALTSGSAAAAEKPSIQYDQTIGERRNFSKLTAKFVLKRAGTLYVNFAQHRSHSSHSSHSSHYSSSTGSSHSSHSSHYSSSTVYIPQTSSTPSYRPSPVPPVYVPAPPDNSIRKKNRASRPAANSTVSIPDNPVEPDIPVDDETYGDEGTPTPTPSPVKRTKKSANPNSSVNSNGSMNSVPGYTTSPTPANTSVGLASKSAEAEKRSGGGCFGLIALLTFLGFLPRKKKGKK